MLVFQRAQGSARTCIHILFIWWLPQVSTGLMENRKKTKREKVENYFVRFTIPDLYIYYFAQLCIEHLFCSRLFGVYLQGK
jgi:hypothetical protein